jgi:hypothetical protein
MRPGIPNTHPWNMGIRPPKKPMTRSKMPSEIFSASFIIKMGMVGYSYSAKLYFNFFISAICSGEEPQQPPTTDAPPLRAYLTTDRYFSIDSYSVMHPSAEGSPMPKLG